MNLSLGMNYLCVFSKPPVPGQTKSRLAEVIGLEAAAQLARAMLLEICNVVLEVKGAKPQLWYPPDSSPEDFEGVVPTQFTFNKQEGINLGARMNCTFARLLAEDSKNRVIVIGSDCITHTPNLFREAFSRLASCQVVIQPSEDGGYSLIGKSHWYPNIFEDINWGNDNVYSSSIAKLCSAGIGYRVLPPTFDVDSVDDLLKVKRFIKEAKRPYIRSWMKKEGWV